MKRIGIVSNAKKDINYEVANAAKAFLDGKAEVVDLSELAAKRVYNNLALFEEFSHLDAIVVLGGDGTMLRVAVPAAKVDVPVLGINLGKVGFLAEAPLDKMNEALTKVLDGDYTIENRMLLAAYSEDKLLGYALNDFCIYRRDMQRLINVNISIDGDDIDCYPCDGLIAASPTGSTAYSLSAGGPVISPKVESIVLTPICPHMINWRPIVLPSNERITITLGEDEDKASIVADGEQVMDMNYGQSITISRAPIMTKFIKLYKTNFYEILCDKLHETGRRCK